jgi:hypothetical protein
MIERMTERMTEVVAEKSRWRAMLARQRLPDELCIYLQLLSLEISRYVRLGSVFTLSIQIRCAHVVECTNRIGYSRAFYRLTSANTIRLP